MLVSNHPEDAAEIVRRVLGRRRAAVQRRREHRQPLLRRRRPQLHHDGDDQARRGRASARAGHSCRSSSAPTSTSTSIVLSVGEVFKELVQARRQRRAGVEPRMHRGLPYPVRPGRYQCRCCAPSRTTLVIEEMYRGTPVIYVDYTDYDEIAHHSGPERAETLDGPRGRRPGPAGRSRRPPRRRPGLSVRRALRPRPEPRGDLPAALRPDAPGCHLAPDGRRRFRPGRHRAGRGVGLGQRVPQRGLGDHGSHRGDGPGRLPRAQEGRGRRGRAGQAGPGRRGRARRNRSGGDGTAGSGGQLETGGAAAVDARPELVVCASGNLALVYFPRLEGRARPRGHRRSVSVARRGAGQPPGRRPRHGPQRRPTARSPSAMRASTTSTRTASRAPTPPRNTAARRCGACARSTPWRTAAISS